MLSTQTVRDITDNVVTDINANVPAPEEPRKRTLSREAAILLDKSIVARPLMVPEVCSIRVKNLEYAYRWVNKAGRNGAVYMQRRAQGFTNATTDDVEVLAGDAQANNGEIVAGDVILMKIRGDLYDAAIKYNMQKASALQRARGMYLEGGSSDVNSDAPVERKSVAQDARTASTFIPENPDALIASGNYEAAKAQSQEIREKIAASKATAKQETK